MRFLFASIPCDAHRTGWLGDLSTQEYIIECVVGERADDRHHKNRGISNRQFAALLKLQFASLVLLQQPTALQPTARQSNSPPSSPNDDDGLLRAS